MGMIIALACDHGGHALKEKIKGWLTDAGHQVRDFGCCSADSVDYADYAFPAAETLTRGEADRAVLICTTGIGVSICANKVKGVRCALCADTMTAHLTREHNDTNALAIGAGVVGENLARAFSGKQVRPNFHCLEDAIPRHAHIDEHPAAAFLSRTSQP